MSKIVPSIIPTFLFDFETHHRPIIHQFAATVHTVVERMITERLRNLKKATPFSTISSFKIFQMKMSVLYPTNLSSQGLDFFAEFVIFLFSYDKRVLQSKYLVLYQGKQIKIIHISIKLQNGLMGREQYKKCTGEP